MHVSESNTEEDSDYGLEFDSEEEVLLSDLLKAAALASGINDHQDTLEHDQTSINSMQPWSARNEAEPDSSTRKLWSESTSSQVYSSETQIGFSEYVKSCNEQKTGGNTLLKHSNSDSQDIKISTTKSPLEQFRTWPKKPFSVTDLVSPAWCELQYSCTLAKYGRKKPTKAMRQGSALHQEFENEVHQQTEILVTTKEEAFALRILNVIQGLKTLRNTGCTRELEVWGFVHGHLVNGVIDEVSYVCPDVHLESHPFASHDGGGRIDTQTDKEVMLQNENSLQTWLKGPKSLSSMRRWTSKVYISDLKTRGNRTVPQGASFRPTLYQLMLYYHLLAGHAEQKVDCGFLATRYKLDIDASFSDKFLAQIGSLNQNFHDAASYPEDTNHLPESSQDSMDMLMDNNSLEKLWSVMTEEFQRTMPHGRNSLGQVLKAEYRERGVGNILGIKTFLYDENVLMEFLENQMKWWTGERDAQGVSIEEAYKCRSCEFQTSCRWRLSKLEEVINKQRSRTRSLV